jgi:hypothetical protein
MATLLKHQYYTQCYFQNINTTIFQKTPQSPVCSPEATRSTRMTIESRAPRDRRMF